MAMIWVPQGGGGHMRLLRADLHGEYIDLRGFRPTRPVMLGSAFLPPTDSLLLATGIRPHWASPLVGFIGLDADDVAWFGIQPNPVLTEYTAEVAIPITDLSDESQVMLEVALA